MSRNRIRRARIACRRTANIASNVATLARLATMNEDRRKKAEEECRRNEEEERRRKEEGEAKLEALLERAEEEVEAQQRADEWRWKYPTRNR